MRVEFAKPPWQRSLSSHGVECPTGSSRLRDVDTGDRGHRRNRDQYIPPTPIQASNGRDWSESLVHEIDDAASRNRDGKAPRNDDQINANYDHSRNSCQRDKGFWGSCLFVQTGPGVISAV